MFAVEKKAAPLLKVEEPATSKHGRGRPSHAPQRMSLLLAQCHEGTSKSTRRKGDLLVSLTSKGGSCFPGLYGD